MRLALIPVFAILVATNHDGWALFVVAFSSLSDWADGFIARKFNQVSELGKSLDPIADRCFIFVTLVVLVVRDIVPLWLLGLVFLRDVVMLILVSLIARRGHKPMAVTFVGKAATLCLLVAFPLYLVSGLSIVSPSVAQIVTVVAWCFAIAGVILYWASCLQYLAQGRQLLTGSELAQDNSIATEDSPRA